MRYSCLTVPKLIEILQALSSLHAFMELVLEESIEDLGDSVNYILAEGRKRQLHVADNIISSALLDKRRLTRMVKGAIDMTIHAHGPITKDNSHSAAKRAVGFLLR